MEPERAFKPGSTGYEATALPFELSSFDSPQLFAAPNYISILLRNFFFPNPLQQKEDIRGFGMRVSDEMELFGKGHRRGTREMDIIQLVHMFGRWSFVEQVFLELAKRLT